MPGLHPSALLDYEHLESGDCVLLILPLCVSGAQNMLSVFVAES